MFETVINNGLLVDPKNLIMSNLNIGIENGKIAELSNKKLSGKEEYNCTEKVISPGFVDIHIHEDPFNDIKGSFDFCISELMLKMGVTTVIGGNCGVGPLNPLHYLDMVEKLGYPVNIGLLSSHENLRKNIGDFNKYDNVDRSSIDKMATLLDTELRGGTLGLSFGIRYIPGINKAEMLALCKIAQQHNSLIAAHVRDDAENVIPAILEFANIGQETGGKIQISHIGSMAAYGQMEDVCSLIDMLVTNGLDAGMDCYPYSAFSTAIGSATFDQGFLQRYNTDYHVFELTQKQLAGEKLDEHSFEYLRKEDPDRLVIAHVMKDKEIDIALCHPRTIVASDGLLNNGGGHPRAAGTFPRFIKEYVINKKSMSLFEAINKITYLPAKRLNINKGSLSIGSDADIVVFDLNEIRDNATFKEPLKGPAGINYVFIRGKLALKDGVITNNKLGCPIRAGI